MRVLVLAVLLAAAAPCRADDSSQGGLLSDQKISTHNREIWNEAIIYEWLGLDAGQVRQRLQQNGISGPALDKRVQEITHYQGILQTQGRIQPKSQQERQKLRDELAINHDTTQIVREGMNGQPPPPPPPADPVPPGASPDAGAAGAGSGAAGAPGAAGAAPVGPAGAAGAGAGAAGAAAAGGDASAQVVGAAPSGGSEGSAFGGSEAMSGLSAQKDGVFGAAKDDTLAGPGAARDMAAAGGRPAGQTGFGGAGAAGAEARYAARRVSAGGGPSAGAASSITGGRDATGAAHGAGAAGGSAARTAGTAAGYGAPTGYSASGGGGSLGGSSALTAPKTPAAGADKDAAAKAKEKADDNDDELTDDEKKALAEIQDMLKEAGDTGSLDSSALGDKIQKLKDANGGNMDATVSQLEDVLAMTGSSLSMEQRQEVLAVASRFGLTDVQASRLAGAIERAAPPPPGRRHLMRWQVWLLKVESWWQRLLRWLRRALRL